MRSGLRIVILVVEGSIADYEALAKVFNAVTYGSSPHGVAGRSWFAALGVVSIGVHNRNIAIP